MARRRLQVFYEGRVQGVGFRYTARRTAAGFEVTGIIRNLADGRVELIAEGEREELVEFQQAIRDAGLSAHIRNEKENWTDTKDDFKGFEIVG